MIRRLVASVVMVGLLFGAYACGENCLLYTSDAADE